VEERNPSRRVAQFGVFEANLLTGELYKHGIRIRLQQQPFLILASLLENPDEVVTREELQKKLWPADTFVDFNLGLDAAVYKLRQALGDTAESPRFVETLSRRGYRFIAPVAFRATGASSGKHSTSTFASAAPALAEEQLPHEAVASEIDLSPSVASGPPSTTGPRRNIRPHTWAILVAGAALVLVALASWQRSRPPVAEPVIAVLPFTDLAPSGTPYFADGLTDELIRNLSVIEGLQVRSRTSSFAFKDRTRNLREVGRQLNANLVLEGSVLRIGDQLRINAQLIRVSDDHLLWSGRYDRQAQDVFLIQDEIARAIVNQLRLKLGGGRRRYNLPPETYDSYLKARSLSNRIFGKPGQGRLEEALRLFQQVAAKSPDFAPAHAGIGTAYAALTSSQRFAAISPDEAYVQMRHAAMKALELDPLLAEAHVTMALVHQRDLQWSDAEKSFRRAIELDPNSWFAHAYYGMYLMAAGRKDEAAKMAARVADIDPLAAESYLLRTLTRLCEGDYQAAIESSRRMLALEPEHGLARQLLARALTHTGKPEEAIALLQGRLGSEHYLGHALAKANRRAEAEELAARLNKWPNVVAPIYAGLGDKERTIAALEEMAKRKDVRTDIYPHFPEFAFLRDDPRMQQLRRRRGFSSP
jgi:TolB-like protein/DNA-binding winged helix-turn-helix (wHTH) protein/Tfp pilus assembly protein PilF